MSFYVWQHTCQARMICFTMKNFSNSKQNDPHGFKKELKIKYDAILAVAGKFPNRTGRIMELLKVETPPLDWADYYCVMDVIDQAIWEPRGHASTKVMLFLFNSKKYNAKKDLCLSYSQGNKSASPTTAKAMTRYLSTQYPNKTIGHKHN